LKKLIFIINKILYMKKIVRLTENDLNLLVKRVVNEQKKLSTSKAGRRKPILKEEFIEDHSAFIMKDGTAEMVQDFLNLNSRKKDNLKFIALINCEYVDFSDADICEYPNLHFINLTGTPNNFEEVVDCPYINLSGDLYEFKIEN